MENYITDERTGIRYELVGDYYLPIDFGIKPLTKKAVQESETIMQEGVRSDRPVDWPFRQSACSLSEARSAACLFSTGRRR